MTTMMRMGLNNDDDDYDGSDKNNNNDNAYNYNDEVRMMMTTQTSIYFCCFKSITLFSPTCINYAIILSGLLVIL